jgi:hypothetical protein
MLVGPPSPEPRHVSYDAPPSLTERVLLSDLSAPKLTRPAASSVPHCLPQLPIESVRARLSWIFPFHRCRVYGPSLNFLHPLSCRASSFVSPQSSRASAPFPSIILRLNADPPLDSGYDLTLCLCTMCTPSIIQALGDLMHMRNTSASKIGIDYSTLPSSSRRCVPDFNYATLPAPSNAFPAGSWKSLQPRTSGLSPNQPMSTRFFFSPRRRRFNWADTRR